MNGTIKQFKDTIEEMRTLYPFEDDKTYLSTHNLFCRENNRLQIRTRNDNTGIIIVMEKQIDTESVDKSNI